MDEVNADAGTAMACANLASLTLPNGTVTGAEAFDAGAFTPPMAPGGRPLSEAATRQYGELPAFCRVMATLTPTDDSDIKVEVWLPSDAGWNGKLQAVGNGAFTGSIRYGGGRSLAYGLALGYATASTDTGHEGGSASFGLGHPEKVIDFGWRSTHEMTVTAKQVIEAYYGEPAEYAYWQGCSAGGRQALKQAQRFPEDFDGIIAGAPGNDWTGRSVAALRVAKPLETNEGARLLEDKRLLVHEAVLEACDAADGVIDGVVGDPQQCDFDPGTLLCEGADDASCLTGRAGRDGSDALLVAEEPEDGSRDPPGYSLAASSTGPISDGPVPRAIPVWSSSNTLWDEDPEWTIDRFEFERDIVRAEETDNDTLNALDPDLQPLFDNGGKVIVYHGWSDAQISPANATQYYERLVETIGDSDAVHDSYRLFMAPGMGHCGGGQGPNTFNALTALEEWVERGRAPDQIIASRRRDGAVDRTRPLCPVSPGRGVQRHREHRRRRELHVPDAVTGRGTRARTARPRGYGVGHSEPPRVPATGCGAVSPL